MNKIKEIRKDKSLETIKIKRFTAIGLIVGIILLFSSTMVIAKPNVTVVVYDDFNYTNVSNYFAKWFSYEFLPNYTIEPQAIATRSFGGKLHLQATPYTQTQDNVRDHVKYLALSKENFSIPISGSITFSADIDALTPGINLSKQICPTNVTLPCKKVLEGQQAAATLHMINKDTGQLFDWFISEHKAVVLTERLLAPQGPGVGLSKGYTQFVPGLGTSGEKVTLVQQLAEFNITPGFHHYAIRYSRSSNGKDKVEWSIDGIVKTKQHKVGIPLDVQNKNRKIEYPSINATGELLGKKMTVFVIGHGLFSLVDDFPFSPQYAPFFISYPNSSRIFGQGTNATFENFTVETISR